MLRHSWVKWLLWLLLTAAIGGYFGWQLTLEKEKPQLLIGQSSQGHHQIEMVCETCHTSPFGGKDVLQDACINCHGEELKNALDSHPLKKFKDPRNADRIAILDARYCVTCHREHSPDITRPMAVTLPEDYCLECHKEVGEERDSHRGLGFETCASAGCHNFHDNKALYENFLLKHADEPDFKDSHLPHRNLKNYIQDIGQQWSNTNSMTVPDELYQPGIESDWRHSAHGRAEVACTNCHVATDAPGEWLDKPDHRQCATCHANEVTGFLDGKHGMRLNQGLSAMTTAMARLPMNPESGHRELTCNSCHAAHEDNTAFAATQACLGCHADEHSLAFENSPHARLQDPGVSCATCHMPRVEKNHHGIEHIQVEHNQNATLRPNEKMIRPVCMSCHGLSFAIDALADPALIKNNFNGSPQRHIESIDMAVKRDKPTTF
jgi:Cytochrome c3